MQEKSFGKKFGMIFAGSVGMSVLIWFGLGAAGVDTIVLQRLVGIVLVIAIYAALLALPKGSAKEKGLFQNLKYKIPIILVISVIIWFAAGKMGFPIWWQIEFVAFALVGLFYFVLLDWRTLKPEKSQWHSTFRLIMTYAFASVLFIVITAQLPQFDPQVEIDKLDRPPRKLEDVAGPELIAAGREIFEENKCFNCHKVFWEGNSDRGPNLGTKQVGLYPSDYLIEQIVEPRKIQSPGFDDPKSKKAMPTYYGDDIDEGSMKALVAYLRTMRDPTNVPVEGKLGSQWTWWDDPKIIEEGKIVFEGLEPATEGLNCAVCHGKDGIPMMTGALDFRNENNPDTDKMPDHIDKVMKDWPDELWYKRVTRGVDGTPMAPWGAMFPHLYLWKAEVYARTFHDPLEKRTEKRPIPPVPTKEDMERWKTEGLFMDPLL